MRPNPDQTSDAQYNGAGPAGVRVALEVEIPSDVRYIERVVGLVTRQCEEMEFPARQVALNVPVALTEALANAILYGNRQDRDKHVRIRASLDAEALVVEVEDEGLGFDLEASICDPTTPENLLREKGRGLFLMRKLMDQVEQTDRQGNVVRLTLRRT